MQQPLDQTRPDQRQLVLGTFEDQSQAGSAIRELRNRGVAEDTISVVVRHASPEVSAGEMAALDQDAESTGTDVAVGGMAGGLAGFVAGLALFSIPGLGPFLGIGVLAGTLGGAALGSAMGERTAHLSQLGIPADRAERYHGAMQAGYAIVAVVAADAATAMTAREVFGLYGADEVDAHPYRAAEDFQA